MIGNPLENNSKRQENKIQNKEVVDPRKLLCRIEHHGSGEKLSLGRLIAELLPLELLVVLPDVALPVLGPLALERATIVEVRP